MSQQDEKAFEDWWKSRPAIQIGEGGQTHAARLGYLAGLAEGERRQRERHELKACSFCGGLLSALADAPPIKEGGK